MYNIKHIDNDNAISISQVLGISEAFSKILVCRGLDTPFKIKKFLNPRLSFLHNPFLLDGMDKAVLRIKDAIKNQEKIFIYGDKDVDGQTSVVLLKNILKDYGLDSDFFIPSSQGYGIHESIINTLLEKEIKLLITVDCGITNHKEIELITQAGMDVIILDHHEAPKTLPNATAIVDPKLIGSKYPFKDIAGCAVVFKLGWALYLSDNIYFNKEISTIALNIPKNASNAHLSILNSKNGVEAEILEFQAQNADFELEKIFEALDKSEVIVTKDTKLLKDILKNDNRLENFHIMNIPDITKNLYPDLNNSLDSLYKNFYIAEEESEVKKLSKLFWILIMSTDYGLRSYIKKYLDFVALGTIADVMPLISENRCMVKHGLKIFKNTRSKGLGSLRDSLLEEKKDFNVKDISWGFIPVINSAGRMNKPEVGVNLMLADDKAEIEKHKTEIMNLNKKRKKLQNSCLELANILVKEQCNPATDSLIFIVSDKLDKAVIGIIAANLVKKYNRPAAVCAIEEGEVVGSLRSINNYDLINLLNESSDLLVKYGGHKQAGGMTIKLENIEEAREKLKSIAARDMEQGHFKKNIDIDLTINQKEMSIELLNEILLLEPFGPSNFAPNILIKDVSLDSASWMGTSKTHFKGTLKLKDGSAEIIGWDMKRYQDILKPGKYVDLITTIETNHFNGRETIRFQLLNAIN